MTQSWKKDDPSNVKLGDFPFPLTRGPRESRYLTWLRNHSNYMVSRGVVDNFRAVAVLLRGIVLNFFVLLSVLLVVSAAIGHLYHTRLRSSTISAADFLDLGAFAEMVENGTRPIDVWLRSQITGEADDTHETRVKREVQRALTATALAHRELKRTQDSNDAEAQVKAAQSLEDAEDKFEPLMVMELSAVIGDLFDNEFPDKTLSDESQKLLKTKPKGAHLRHRNRLIFANAYPKELAKNEISSKSVGDWIVSPSMPEPFRLTLIVTLLALSWVVFSPVLLLFSQISGQRKSVETGGGDSSVECRDRFERTFSFSLIAIVSVACFECLPNLVYYFHQFQDYRVTMSRDGDWWNGIFGLAGGTAAAVLSAAGKLMTVLGGATRKLAMLLLGLLGLLIPLLVVLHVTDFLVYQEPYEGWLNLAVVLLPAGLSVLTVIAIVVGLVNQSFSKSEYLKLVLQCVLLGVGSLVVGLYLFAEVSAANDFMRDWNYLLVLIGAFQLWLFCRLVIDINRTSIHGLYRDRLASAYLVGLDTKEDVAIEHDINLADICCHEAGSTAPYHLVNVALNLQGSKDPSIRDRHSDFFIFSKRFIGGARTGYCRSETLEQIHPQMNLATAMAISAAAASPNMGSGTNAAMVSFMVLLNVRLGYWLPNPGLLEHALGGKKDAPTKTSPPGFCFDEVFADELKEVVGRWKNAYAEDVTEKPERQLCEKSKLPTTRHGLIGIGFSGGGIRSATINLGIAQTLNDVGIFRHLDFMSTVSGGGYLGSAISTLMRRRPKFFAEVPAKNAPSTNAKADKAEMPANLPRHGSLSDRFRWRVPPRALLHEMLMQLNETRKWVNLSDGGHIENLAGIELLRRRCQFIILGDGEADPDLYFNGLATLIRFARIDLGIDIAINPEAIRVNKSRDAVEAGKDNLSRKHYAVGTITYPKDPRIGCYEEETGYLLYLKSSFTDDEDEVITEYRHRNPDFPHQHTADQQFDEAQFECYRALGQHIGKAALKDLGLLHPETPVTAAEFKKQVAEEADRLTSMGAAKP